MPQHPTGNKTSVKTASRCCFHRTFLYLSASFTKAKKAALICVLSQRDRGLLHLYILCILPISPKQIYQKSGMYGNCCYTYAFSFTNNHAYPRRGQKYYALCFSTSARTALKRSAIASGAIG